jgi:hypothetical protein
MYLISYLIGSQGSHVLMCPRVAGNLVTVSVHSSDNLWESSFLNVNLALSHIVAGNEKGCFGVVRC